VAKESAAFWVNNTPYFVWDNGGADAQASTGDNWDYHAVPGKSDTVRFGPVSVDVTWDLGLDTVTVFSIEDGFSNRVTFDNASVPDTVFMDSISVASGALLDLDGTVILAEVFNEAGTAQYTGEYTPSNSSVLTGSGAILTNVTGPPSPITLNQTSFSVQEGETVQIVVNAYGATPFDYRWTRVSTGGEVARTDNTNSNHDTLVIQNVTKADHDGRQYRCEVTNPQGSATSETVTLNVYLELNAAFDVTREFHQDGMDATFTDQSTGDIGKWRWVFGDGQDRPYNDYQAQVVHTYSDTGTYQCTLYVEGSQPAMGSDFAAMQIEYYPPDTSNPLVIRDEDVGRLDGRTVAFTVRNLDSIEVMFAEDVDVGIWLARQSLGENKTVIDSVFKRYRDLDSLKNAGPSTNTFSDTIRIEDPLARRYEIWASPIVDGTPRAFVLGKQEDFYFEIRDTLSLSGNYLGNTGTLDDVQLDIQHLEDARVRLVHSAELDTPLVDSVILEYGFEMDNYLVSDRVAASQVVQDDPFIWSITDEEFMSRDTTRVYVRVRQKGRNDITPKSDTVSFLTGWPVPENPSLLSIQHKTAYSIRIGWDATDADAPDSLRIWRIQDSAEILVNRPNNWGGFNAFTTDKMQDERVFDNLRQNTWYSFAMQVYADRQWSYVGPNAYKIVRTDTSGVRLPPQVLARMGIDSLHYDPSNRQLRCYWRADTIVSDMRVAITWSTDPAAYTRDTIFATDPRDVTSPTGVIIDTFDVDSIFNDSLYVFLWGGKQGSYDHDAVRKKMVDAVWIPQPSWQRVVYFPQGVDTVRAFRGEFFIAGPYSLPDTTHDRVYREQLSSAHQGFIDLGGYSLQKNAREPLWIGVRYDHDSIPADTMVSTLGMYRVRDGAVERVYTSMNHDSARHIMWFRTHEFSDATTGDSIPFFVLADTAAPRITFVGDTADTTAIGRSDSVAYRFTVDDNIANVRWQMRVSYIRTNGEVEDTLLHGFTAGSGDDTGKVVVDNDLFAVNFGALLHFELWDGVHPLSYDLSRRIEKQVVVISDEEKWIPLFVTSHLDSMEPSQVLMPLSSQQATFTYDNTQFRLFKWFPDKGDDGDWVEYSDWQGYENTQKEQLKGDYALRPGTVQWLKTKKTKQFPCGIGMTPSLRDTHIISLHPGAWTDCANPFGFHIDMNDIAAATDTSKFEQLEVFLWRQRGGNDGRYTTPVMMYTPNWAEKNEYDHLLFTDSAYTIYNPTDTEIQLKIPPVPKAHTAFPNRGVDKRSGAGNGWHVEVITRDAEGTYIGSNYCGYDPSRSTTRYSAAMPPSWGRLHSGVMRHTDNAMSLYCVHGDTKEQGYRYRLKFTNTSDTARQVRVALRTAGAIPEDARIALVRSGTQGRTIEPVAAEDETQSFTIPAHGACTRVLLVGSDAYISRIASFKAALVRCTPSPFSRMVRVHYSVPAGVRDVAVQIYDYMGRRVWARRIHEPAAGVHALTWRPDAAGAMTAAGVYVVEMTVHDDNAAVIGQFRKKINYIP
jgi:PKD repeat protein